MKRDIQVIDKPTTQKLSNRLENNFHLSNKKALFYNITQYFYSINEDPFQHVPLTFHIKEGIKDQQFKKFLKYYREKKEKLKKLQ